MLFAIGAIVGMVTLQIVSRSGNEAKAAGGNSEPRTVTAHGKPEGVSHGHTDADED